MKSTRKCRSRFRGSSTYLTDIEPGNHRFLEEILSQPVITDGTRGHKAYRMQCEVENVPRIQFRRIASYEFLSSIIHLLGYMCMELLSNVYVNNYRQDIFNICFKYNFKYKFNQIF